MPTLSVSGSLASAAAPEGSALSGPGFAFSSSGTILPLPCARWAFGPVPDLVGMAAGLLREVGLRAGVVRFRLTQGFSRGIVFDQEPALPG
jgi:hypothetical protein